MIMVNMEIGTEAAQFPEKEYINGIFVAVHYEWLCLWFDDENNYYDHSDHGYLDDDANDYDIVSNGKDDNQHI